MSEFKLTTPVALFSFNRPGVTERVFDTIAKAKPEKLLLISDGPRAHRPDDAERVTATREIFKRINWPCEVLENFSDTNVGPGAHGCVARGLDWVFSQVPEAIILEDDCLPHPTFFRYCQEMLAFYRDDDRISLVGGSNVSVNSIPVEDSYFFSRYSITWGWASWRRVWEKYDPTLSLWPAFRDEGGLSSMSHGREESAFWRAVFDDAKRGRARSAWDYAFALGNWAGGRISVVPAVNLVSNIGFGVDATNTLDAQSVHAEILAAEMRFPLRHPAAFRPLVEADADFARNMFSFPIPLSFDESRVKAAVKERAVFLLAPLSRLGSSIGRYVAQLCESAVVAAIDDRSEAAYLHGVPRWTCDQFAQRLREYPDAIAVDFSVSPQGKAWAAALCEENCVGRVDANEFFDERMASDENRGC